MTENQILAIGDQVGLCDAEGLINLEYDYRNQIIAFAYLIYELGFVDGMQKQMKSSVDKAVNLMAQREWVGLTADEKQTAVWTDGSFGSGALWAEATLKGKNNG